MGVACPMVFTDAGSSIRGVADSARRRVVVASTTLTTRRTRVRVTEFRIARQKYEENHAWRRRADSGL
jgi:hypothetical protein